MSYTTLDIKPLIATEVKTDVDTLTSGTIAKDLRALLARRGVIFFRGLEMSDEQQLQFARTLGATRDEHGTFITKITANPELSPIFADYTKGTYFFHFDGAYTDRPGLASILRAKTVAPKGGQTEFVNTYALYDDLSEAEKHLVDGLHAVHSSERIQRLAFPNPTAEQLALWGEGNNPPQTHPLVWQHQSGRKSLLLSYGIKYIVGMDYAESSALLTRLLGRAERAEYIYTHDWQVGDVLIWDNTGTMHRITPYDLSCGRLLHRITLLGEETITAPTQRAAAA